MAAEIFTVGQRSFHLPGLGAYLQAAAFQGNLIAIAWGLGTLIFVIVIMDQWIWRPLLTWADRFKIEMMESDTPPTSWFYNLLHNARIVRWFEGKIAAPVLEWFDSAIVHRYPMGDVIGVRDEKPGAGFYLLIIAGAGLLLYGGYNVGTSHIPSTQCSPFEPISFFQTGTISLRRSMP
jgi:NitT/TauT family transport system permease protein